MPKPKGGVACLRVTVTTTVKVAGNCRPLVQPAMDGTIGLGANALRQQKLDRQRVLMEQKRRQRQMQSAMMMTQNSATRGRPLSSRYLRPTSQPSPAKRSISADNARDDKHCNENTPSSASTSLRPSDPPSPSHSPSLTPSHSPNPTTPPSTTHTHTSTHRESVDSLQEAQDDDRPCSSDVAAKLSAMGLAPSLDYQSEEDSSEEDEDEEEEMTGKECPTVDLPTVIPFSSADEESLSGRVAPSAPSTTPVPAREITPKHIDIGDLKSFVMRPAPDGTTIKCRVTRDKRGVDKSRYPIYYLHLEREGTQEKVFLLAARKRKKSRSSNYLISVDPVDLSRQGTNFVAKLRSNFLGTSFTVYDSGLNPNKRQSRLHYSSIREEVSLVHYDTNVLGFKGPRKMTVVIPALSHTKERIPVKPKRESETLLERWRNDHMSDLLQLHNKQPTWSEETQAYVLNFHGRVTQASVKNFQLVHTADENYIVVQFGRISEDVFTMDYQFPVCAVQAFAIALSSFDSKLACE